MDGLFSGKSHLELDDDLGYPYDLGNHHLNQWGTVSDIVLLQPSDFWDAPNDKSHLSNSDPPYSQLCAVPVVHSEAQLHRAWLCPTRSCREWTNKK